MDGLDIEFPRSEATCDTVLAFWRRGYRILVQRRVVALIVVNKPTFATLLYALNN